MEYIEYIYRDQYHTNISDFLLIIYMYIGPSHLFVCGRTAKGVLGIGKTNDSIQNSPVELIIKKPSTKSTNINNNNNNNNNNSNGKNSNGPTSEERVMIENVSFGDYHLVILSEDGQVYTCGRYILSSFLLFELSCILGGCV